MPNHYKEEDDRTPSYESLAACEHEEGQDDPEPGIGPDGGPPHQPDGDGEDAPQIPPTLGRIKDLVL